VHGTANLDRTFICPNSCVRLIFAHRDEKMLCLWQLASRSLGVEARHAASAVRVKAMSTAAPPPPPQPPAPTAEQTFALEVDKRPQEFGVQPVISYAMENRVAFPLAFPSTVHRIITPNVAGNSKTDFEFAIQHSFTKGSPWPAIANTCFQSSSTILRERGCVRFFLGVGTPAAG
jgi:hypothetical protein